MIIRYLKLCLLILCIVNSPNCYPQFVSDTCAYKYFFGTSEPDTTWKKLSFDDYAWETGVGRIGYGEKDIKTQIKPSTSVFIRVKFLVPTKKGITKLGFTCDYNDGYVAYLNGREIARANLGNPGDTIPFNRVTDRSHKSIGLIYPGSGYYLDDTAVINSLNTGMNILALEVHNDSINGSDLSLKFWLIDLTGGNNQGNFRRQIKLDSTKFPIIIINTDGKGLSRDNKSRARMGIINNQNGKYNKPSDALNDYDGWISIKIHGQSSSAFPKKTYAIETQNGTGDNNNVPLIGMPAENDWILFGPFVDKSLIRNELAFNIGRRQGYYEPRTRFCELIFDGDFMGFYVLTEKIKRDSNRVDVSKLKNTDNNGEELTGGYIIKYDAGEPDSGSLFWVYPKKEEITKPQKKYIFDYLKDFYSTLDAPEFLDPVYGYRRYIDVESLIDYIIAEEAMKNCDAYYRSTYLYKEKITHSGKLKYGPLWDHDLAFGNGYFQDGCNNYGWQFEENQGNGYTNNALKIMKMMRDSDLVNQLEERWKILRTGFLSTDSMLNEIDSLTNYIKDAQVRNYKVWPVIQFNLFGECNSVASYSEDIAIMKLWIQQRLIWIDNNIGKIRETLVSTEDHKSTINNICVFPNPFENSLTVECGARLHENIFCSIYNIYGQKVYASGKVCIKDIGRFVINSRIISNLPSGIYLISIMENGSTIYKEKLIKK